MRDVRDVLKERELLLETVRREVEALRSVAPMLADEKECIKVSNTEEIAWKDATTGELVKL
jgi:hypothetical protein